MFLRNRLAHPLRSLYNNKKAWEVNHIAVIGKTVLELAPGENNPRSSEGAFLDLTDGRILFVYSKFLGDCGEDDASCCIAARYSSDGGWGGRAPLVCALSSDEGAGWTKEFYLEDGSEDAGYCYTAIHPGKDSVLLACCAGKREDGGCLNRLRVRKISLSDFA